MRIAIVDDISEERTLLRTRQVMAVEKYQKIDYNFHKILIPGSKGQKADASLLARGFLTS